MLPCRGQQIGHKVGTRLTIQPGQGHRVCRASIPAARSDAVWLCVVVWPPRSGCGALFAYL